MFRALVDLAGGRSHADISFRDTGRWHSIPSSVGTPMTTTAVVFGDDECGPVLLLFDLAPGACLPDSPAHGHASDSWRTALLGTLVMGRDRYEPGDFRFQHGGKPYASDNLANGPEGGWTALLFGDRRGMRPRHVRHEGPPVTTQDREWSAYLDVTGDLVSDEPQAAPGPSSFASTFDAGNVGARVNGTFRDTRSWVRGRGCAVAAAMMGDVEAGPVVLLVDLEPGARSPAWPVDGDVVRLVCRGAVRHADRERQMGDVYVQGGGAIEATVAGPDGASELIVVGDRRSLPGDLGGSGGGSVLTGVVGDLRRRVEARAVV